MASGKYSIDTLREELFQRGMYFSTSTRRWTRSHLAKLLRHPFYIGKIPWHGQIETGKQENIRDPAKILELAQHLAGQYVTLPAPQKRQIADSVFSNLQLDDVTLCGNYRLPFSILAENGNHPLNYA